MKTVAVTGGAGYIGTHILVALSANGFQGVCIDNFSNSSPRALDRARRIADARIECVELDIRDEQGLRTLFARHEIDSVIHLAGLKAVGESVEQPLRYYENNVSGTVTLLSVLAETSVRKFVFSSSATVYGPADRMPIAETSPTQPQNPYGRTKLIAEQVLTDQARADSTWRVASLRYFNPAGAHESGLIGEQPSGIPNNLMPYVCHVAAGRRTALRVFGNDYATRDGTGVRDFIHVMDLAEGHVAALKALDAPGRGGVTTLNLGTGRGHSVLELVARFEKVNNVSVPCDMAARRAGDVAECYADASLAKRVLGWEARRSLDDMCRDAWRWQQQNPQGY